ncbi:hypothetical protein IEQ34_000695 [Dendrobium chrysotoxum]|uniref:Uncharacterized protein n=1 Tax=Dendrobium chrysotoxum TaxID=161865 RepID=A0AAV7HTP7_DENCH|nr:hypothetical protein IEQ34_000695 [Dendrobium chrysotoxum]
MGQAFRKLKPGQEDLLQKEQLDIKKLIQDVLDQEFTNLASTIKTVDDFYHVIYEIVELLNEKKGAMQFKLPTIKSLQEEVAAVQKKRGAYAVQSDYLNHQELKEVILNVINIEDFQIGRAKDIFLFIYGVPVVGLLAKRIIPGPTAYIPDEIFIPAMTSGTIILLAKTNRI